LVAWSEFGSTCATPIQGSVQQSNEKGLRLKPLLRWDLLLDFILQPNVEHYILGNYQLQENTYAKFAYEGLFIGTI